MSSNIFSDSDIIYSYTWDDGVNDGLFVKIFDPSNPSDVDSGIAELSRDLGFRFPMALTSNLMNTWIIPSEKAMQAGQDLKGRLWDVLSMLRNKIKTLGPGESLVEFQCLFDDGSGKKEKVTLWAGIKGRSPSNPEPIITIMLPSDY